MPQVTVYIRDEDLPKWKAIERKSEFVHNALWKEGSAPAIKPKWDESPSPAPLAVSLPPMQMACCKLLNPCKHWKFNELESNYTNTLTGEIREVV